MALTRLKDPYLEQDERATIEFIYEPEFWVAV